ncbi:hypothetical protein BV22DRAFT_1058240 [Leucogyrophana mollusca]|uniref:Uncharacterized protein n=1 Tax=Leucogyrophana mollusca TaxID=85980 RepID=A0ACB8BVW6_9AGAM|nr:hypothetical protein BV22DRAFT_1058240 [Leucogyrophana mollusca]
MRTDRSSATATEEGVSGRIERWTTHKWCLLLSVLTVFSYGTAILTYSILTWFGTWEHATVSYVANYDILILATLAGSVLVLSALLGALGTLLNSRPILAIYALLLWPALIALFAVGYTAYKRATFSLTSKLDFAWSHYYTAYGRLLLQDALHCCGYLSPLHAAEPSARCYARTALPGCKGKLYRVEQKQLVGAWGVAFAVAPLHLVVMVVALLCANHVTRTFGKGVMPREYWLTVADVRADAERVAKAAWVLSPKVVRTGGGDVPREDTECCDQRAL